MNERDRKQPDANPSATEPDVTNGNSLTLNTSYTYTVLDALSSVTTTDQHRTYSYDGLGKLLSTVTPEGGTTCYGSVSGSTCNTDGYDSFDNMLLKRTDARAVLTTYGYDGLNRLTSVSYSDVVGVSHTSPVSLTYGLDSSCISTHGAGCIGQLISMTDGVGSENYTYNALEQMTKLQKVVNGTTYITSYLYNLAGELTQVTYPSGRAITQNLDTVGRLSSIVGALNSVQTTYASGYGYSPANQLTGFQYGNGIFASLGFSSDRLQLNCLDYSSTNRGSNCSHDGTTKFGLDYSYGTAGSNNGQISKITDRVDNGRTVNYTFDGLARLSTAVTTGSAGYPQWGLSWGYDRYGNRWNQTKTAGSAYQGAVTVDLTTNRIMQTTGTTYAYDASGNMTNDNMNNIVYDAENRATSATNQSSAGAYVYDANGSRVVKCVPNCTSPTTRTIYVFSGSKVIAEYDNGALPSAPSREYVYGGGMLLARIDSSGIKYYHRDQLSNRLVTDSNGNTYAQMGHFPFGDPWYNTANDKLYFTTYERDNAESSGNDYAVARYYVWRIGRFLSLDPFPGSKSDPQSLNRYEYVEDDPIGLSDPSGKCPNWGPFLTCGSAGTHIIDPYASENFQLDFLSFIFANTGNCEDCGPAFGNLNLFLDFGPDNGGQSACAPGALMTGCLVNQAYKRALDLLNSKDCSDFIAGLSLLNPAAVLNALIAGNTPYGTVQVANIEPLNGVPVVAKTIPGPSTTQNLGLPGQTLNATTGSATITVNSNPSNPFNNGWPPGADFGVNQTTRNALDLLHELGHAINDISGGQNSGIMFDGNRVPGGIAVSSANQTAVTQHCLPR